MKVSKKGLCMRAKSGEKILRDELHQLSDRNSMYSNRYFQLVNIIQCVENIHDFIVVVITETGFRNI